MILSLIPTFRGTFVGTRRRSPAGTLTAGDLIVAPTFNCHKLCHRRDSIELGYPPQKNLSLKNDFIKIPFIAVQKTWLSGIPEDHAMFSPTMPKLLSPAAARYSSRRQSLVECFISPFAAISSAYFWATFARFSSYVKSGTPCKQRRSLCQRSAYASMFPSGVAPSLGQSSASWRVLLGAVIKKLM